MPAKRKRRVRTSHPGVKLIKLQRKEGALWHARWVDPDTRRSQQVSLNSIGVTSDSARRAWAISKSRVIANRRAELARLRWCDVHLSQDEIRLSHKATKTGHGRVVRLDVTPLLADMLTRMQLKADGAEFVFGYVEERDGRVPVQHYMRRDIAETARRRMVDKHGAPAFTWHELRRTCGTFLTCAPKIYGGASAYMSAKRLGHSVAVAERHYLGALHSVPKNAKTLEAAMEIEKWMTQQHGDKKDQPPLAS